MKHCTYTFFTILYLTFILSCNKDKTTQTESPVGFTIVHAWTGGDKIIANFSNDPVLYYSTAKQLNFGSFFEYSPMSGSIPIKICLSTDTIKPVYSNTINLVGGGVYTLFLLGEAGQPDTVLIKEAISYHSASDSVVGVRFINLCPDGPISVNIEGNAPGSEVNGLAYKTASGFKSYPATLSFNNYVYEIRNTDNGSLLSTYTYRNLARFRNVTIVLKGKSGGSGKNALGTFLVNNY